MCVGSRTVRISRKRGSRVRGRENTIKSSSIRFSSDAVLCVDVFDNFMAVGMENGTVESDRRSSKKVVSETCINFPCLPMKDEKLAVSASDDTTVRVHSLDKKGLRTTDTRIVIRWNGDGMSWEVEIEPLRGCIFFPESNNNYIFITYSLYISSSHAIALPFPDF